MGKKLDSDGTSLGKVLSLYTLLLFEKQRFSLTELAKKMQVSKPTMLRYLARLEESPFCQIQSGKRGRENTYWLERPATLPKISLNAEGLQQLALCRDFMLHILPEAMHIQVDTVLQQATAFLPQKDSNKKEVQENDMEKGLLSIGQAFTKGRIDYAPFKNTLETLMQAIREHIVCEITYKSTRKGPGRTFEYAPKRLVAFREAIHISGWKVSDKGAVSIVSDHATDLALHRIIKIQLTRRSSSALPDIVEKHEGSFGYMEDEPFTVKIKFASSAAMYVGEREWSTDQDIKDHKNGAITLTLTARSALEIRSWVLGFGADAELLSPDWLREEMAEAIEHLYKAYA